MERIQNLASFAANWWANRLRKVDKSAFENGLKDEKADIIRLLGKINVLENQIREGYEEKVDLFEEILYTLIVEELMRTRNSVYLSVDYEPEGLLNKALEKAKLMTSNVSGLPWKTSMDISMEYGVSISRGGSPFRTLMY